MESRLTRRPGQAGTKKYLQRYGERLVCVRYLYDSETGRRHKTIELIVDTVPRKHRGFGNLRKEAAARSEVLNTT